MLEATFGVGTYNAVYNKMMGTSIITTSHATTAFVVLTDDVLQDVGDWSGPSIDTSTLKSINEVLRNTATQDAVTYESGVIDRLNVHNLYMRSNLGGFNTIGPRAKTTTARNTIRKRFWICHV